MKDHVRGPSVKALAEHLAQVKSEHTQKYHHAASQGRYNWDPLTEAMKIKVFIEAGTPRRALEHYDKVVVNHGIEHITSRAGKTTYYSNTGDSYGTTLLYTPGGAVRIGNWASMVERGGYDGADAGLGGAKTSRKASGGSACRSKTGRFIKCRR